jgi:DNA repair protein RadC
LREKICEQGLGALLPHELLEYFLFPFVPRRNTNDIAHALLRRFGSLSAVFDAEYDALLTVHGMTANAALFLSQIPALLVQYKLDKAKHQLDFLQPEQVAVYLNELIGNRPIECCAALAVDTKGKLLGTVHFDSHRADAVAIDVRKLIREVLVLRATGVVIAHNHPSGDVTPSAEDHQVCDMVRDALRPLGIVLLDCIIVGGGKAYSMLGERQKSGADGSTDTKGNAANTHTADQGHEIDAGEPVDEYNLLFNRNETKS